ncbi:hypothetical protein NSQ96_02790 [Caldifermentibacillus hisashii]|uniref:hypothetical protein n=1 Tax=Caldifermentibacillus hisashii TaxID=996558 RepID=UPI0031FDA2F3
MQIQKRDSKFFKEKSHHLLVVNFERKMFYFGDEPGSRHRFRLRKLLFWRRDPFSSPFFGEKSSILTTSPVLVTNLGRKMLNFDDEACSRHRF